MDLNERKLKVLQAIIADFIMTGEPVGSRTLSKKYDLGVSPATIRNEMADLEDMGYLTHPHTSAGRVPSDMAYRLYVNELMNKKKLSIAERRQISRKLFDDISEFEETLRHAATLLSEITNLMSFAITPEKNEDTLKYINVLPVDERTVVLMIVSESGKVSNTALKMSAPYSEKSIELLSKSMTYNYKGKTISEALKVDIIKNFEQDMEVMESLAENIMPNFLKTLESMLDVNLYMDGLKNIFSIPEYNDVQKAKMFLELIDKKEDFTKTLINREDGVIITIGEENVDHMMQNCSLITATYHVDGKLVGKIGVIGPTRMKYDEVTSVIECITESLNKRFNKKIETSLDTENKDDS